MSENMPVKKAETATTAPKPEQKTSLSRRELLQKAGWVVPAVAVVGLTRLGRPAALQGSISF